MNINKIGTNVDCCERCGAVISDRYSGTIGGEFYWNLCEDCYKQTKEYEWEEARSKEEDEYWERVHEEEEQMQQYMAEHYGRSEEDGSL